MRRIAVNGIVANGAGAVAVLLIAGFLGSALIRFGPGYESDERVLDSRFSAESLDAITKENRAEPNVFLFYCRYLNRAMHGDIGRSRVLDVPIAPLIRDRGLVTLKLIAAGVASGWCLGFALAALAVYFPWTWLRVAGEGLSGAALSLPAAVFAVMVFLSRKPVFLALAVVIFPKIYRYSFDLLRKSRSGPRIEAARARGISESGIFWNYSLRPALPSLAALAGVSFTVAFGALIPVEALCDIAGLGQLAWKAASNRDLPVLVALTLLVTAVTLTANGLAEWVRMRTAEC